MHKRGRAFAEGAATESLHTGSETLKMLGTGGSPILNEFHEIARLSSLLPSLVYHLSTFNTFSHLKDLAGTIIRGARNHWEVVF